MCGIAGFVGTRRISDEAAQSCLKLMGRRGPDATGLRRFALPSDRHVLLLHSRLSIIDLDSRSNQPFNVGRRWMALNGELYNYVELKERLSADGARFRTSSDTEVFLIAIDREGWDVLDRAEGMWALAVYDEDDSKAVIKSVLKELSLNEKEYPPSRFAQSARRSETPTVLFTRRPWPRWTNASSSP